VRDGEELRLGLDPLDPDRDGDGLTDGWELRVSGTRPDRADTDDDGVLDDEEAALGTSAVHADSDADGLLDGEELALGLDPLDPDPAGAGCPEGPARDGQCGGADPLWADDLDHLVDADRDGRGLAAERALGTDPLRADTDGDGLLDGCERAAGAEPTVADSDGDGLLDAEEEALGADPARRDSDGDGLSDADETLGTSTDPTWGDSDHDGLADGEELLLGTDPTAWDTDGDGQADVVDAFAVTLGLIGSDSAEGAWPGKAGGDDKDSGDAGLAGSGESAAPAPYERPASMRGAPGCAAAGGRPAGLGGVIIAGISLLLGVLRRRT
jgi:hypothetical protein